MAGAHVREFTDEGFGRDVLSARGPVVVDFWAEWCAPCKRLSPVIDELAEELGGSAIVGKMDIDAHPRTAEQLGISAIPTVIVFRDGQPTRKFIGLTSKEQLLQAVSEVAGAH